VSNIGASNSGTGIRTKSEQKSIILNRDAYYQ
jgi:hypothetical protein